MALTKDRLAEPPFRTSRGCRARLGRGTDRRRMEIRAAAYQMAVSTDVAGNAARIRAALGRAAAQHADILLTPEGSLSGYTPDVDMPAVREALATVIARAREHHVGLALGTCFIEADGRCYNQLRFYRPDGTYLGFHSKTLCCGRVDGVREGEVTRYAVSDLRTFQWDNGCTIGGLICNDMWANPQCTPMPDPHLSQRLAAAGARVVFHAVNGGRDGSEWSRLAWQYHEANLRMRARAGGLWVVTVDNAAPEDVRCSAPSGVVDPAGRFVCRAAAQGEDLVVHTLALAEVP